MYRAKGEGREQKVIGGFLWRDGEMASLVSGLRRVEDRMFFEYPVSMVNVRTGDRF